jgi:predicted transcriptional regulator YdeE
MKKKIDILKEINLVGVSVRTNNALEMDESSAKIGNTLGNYFSNGVASTIANRVKLNVTYCVYCDYESDEKGFYTYFVGEEVSDFKDVDDSLDTLVIPKQNYAKFNVGPGVMPQVCISAWQDIWRMSYNDFGGNRAYIADFEVYDERASDMGNAVFDIYIGLKN